MTQHDTNQVARAHTSGHAKPGQAGVLQGQEIVGFDDPVNIADAVAGPGTTVEGGSAGLHRAAVTRLDMFLA